MQITAEMFRDVLDYDPLTGVFTWKTNGRIVGWSDPAGYIYIRVFGKLRQAHRIAWLVVHGEWPKENIDHRNRRPWDNRIANLRECTQKQNLANTTVRRDSRTGLKGVTKMPHGRFRAQINQDGKQRHLGMFATAEEAHSAYVTAALALRGEFASEGA